MSRTTLAAAVLVIATLTTSGAARADNILLPISGNWAAKDGANTVIIRLSNGREMLPDGSFRGLCRVEVRDGAGFILNQGDGGYVFRQFSPTQGNLRLDLPGGSIEVQESEFGQQNAFMVIRFGTTKVTLKRIP
jgi:hypothetical protein